MEQQEGKLKSLTLKEKMKLINLVENGKTIKEVSEDYSINRNTLHFILKNRDKIKGGLKANPGISGYKRIKQTKSPELEQRILAYMNESRENNIKLSGNIVKTVALEIAAELGVENFAASNGWLCSFFKRNKIMMSQFNKGTDQYDDDRSKTGAELVAWSEVEEPEEYLEEKFDYQNELLEDEDTPYESVDMNYEVEAIEEDQSYYAIDESGLWRSWCRMCGSRETPAEQDPKHLEIVQQLLRVS